MSASTLYERHGRALLRKAGRILGSRADAEDVVHAVFAEVVARADGDVDLPYLFRAVTNRCVSHLRDERNRARLLANHDDALRGPVRTPMDERVLDLDLLVKLASELEPEAMALVVYRHFDDMTLEEIEKLTGTSRKTIAKRLDEARAAATRLAS